VTPPADYAVSGGTCGGSVPARVGTTNGTCTIQLRLTPTSVGSKDGTLVIVTDATNSPHNVSITGTATMPLTVNKTSLAFGNKTVGTDTRLTFTVTNATSVAATGLTIGMTGASDYTVYAPATTCTSTLNASSSCTVSINFRPGSTGTKTGSASITWDGMPAAKTVALSGAGI